MKPIIERLRSYGSEEQFRAVVIALCDRIYPSLVRAARTASRRLPYVDSDKPGIASAMSRDAEAMTGLAQLRQRQKKGSCNLIFTTEHPHEWRLVIGDKQIPISESLLRGVCTNSDDLAILELIKEYASVTEALQNLRTMGFPDTEIPKVFV